MIDLHESPEHRTPTGTPKVLTLQDQSDIVTYYVDLFWSLLIFADLFWSFMIFSDLLRQAVRPSSTTLQPPSPLPTPVTWEVVHGWTHEWTVVWRVGSIKALSAEGNKEMNGNDTSVNFRRNLGRQRLKNSKYLFCHFFVVFVVIFFVISVLFVILFVIFCYFNFVCHFVCHFFVILILSVILFVIFLSFFFVIWVLDCRFVSHFLSFFCHFSINVRHFCIFMRTLHHNHKKTNFPPNDKKWQTKWQFCRLQKLHFSRSIVIFCLFLSFFNQLPIFLHIFEKIAPQRQKNDKFSTKWQKMTNKMAILQAAKIAFFWKHCHFLSFFCHFSNNFRYFLHIFFRTLHQNDKRKTKFPPNDKKMTNQNWHDKEKNDKKMTKDMTNKTEMTKKWPKNDKQNDRQNWNNKKHDKKRQTKWQTKLKWQKKWQQKRQKMTK